MSEQNKIVIVIASGLDDERSSVAWSVANGGITSGQDGPSGAVDDGPPRRARAGC